MSVEVVKFETPNCRPCKVVQLTLDRIAEKLQEQDIRFVVVNAVQEPERTQALGITSAPTVVVFKDDKEIARFVGAFHKQDDYLAVIVPLLQPAPAVDVPL